jgi:hypothetical protein
MGLRRRRLRRRARSSHRDLAVVRDRTARIRPGQIIALSTLRNERVRLPYFLAYYRKLGISHFLMVDNASDDGGKAYLAAQPDVSLWTTPGSYREARFGMDWLNELASRHADGHWTLTVDPDEFLVYPFCDSRPLRALTDWLDSRDRRSFGAMLIDMYPRGPVDEATCAEGHDPFETAAWFDDASYVVSRNPVYRNLWIQGGPRARVFFSDAPDLAPSLNKIPLVKWRRHYAFVHSTHMLLPRGLNVTYADDGGEKACGALLHAKFLDLLLGKADEEAHRHQHFAEGREYRAYRQHLGQRPVLWTEWSNRYTGWSQLEDLGLISRGGWA